jgi:sugar lactone lactonase YvrE
MLFRAITLVSLYSFVLAELKLEELASMPYVNYRFNTDQERQDYINNKHYQNCTITGVKVASDGTIFLSVPRWKENVPATLAVLDLSDETEGPVLVPFPNWETNLLTTQDGLISVLGFEIDSDDNIWALDQGRVADTAPTVDTAAKLVKFSKNGERLETIYLGSITDPNTAFLNDLVIDKNNNYIYISDCGAPVDTELYEYNSGIIAVNLSTKSATTHLYKHKSVMPDESIWVKINGEKVFSDKTTMYGADGIALSCDGKTLYYTPLTSRILYSISTDILRSGDPSKESEAVKVLGYKISASDGLLMSASNKLYITAIEKNTVYRASDLGDGLDDFNYKKFEVIAQHSDLIWPDTLSIGKQGKNLYIVTNQLHHFFNGKMEFDLENKTPNFRVWTVNIEEYSYVEGCQNDDDSKLNSNSEKGLNLEESFEKEQSSSLRG